MFLIDFRSVIVEVYSSYFFICAQTIKTPKVDNKHALIVLTNMRIYPVYRWLVSDIFSLYRVNVLMSRISKCPAMKLTWTWFRVTRSCFIHLPRTVIPAMEGSNAGPVSVLATIRTTRVCTLCPVRPHLPNTVNYSVGIVTTYV